MHYEIQGFSVWQDSWITLSTLAPGERFVRFLEGWYADCDDLEREQSLRNQAYPRQRLILVLEDSETGTASR